MGRLLPHEGHQQHQPAEPELALRYTCVCLLISVLYVASLYIWRSPHDRNHPTTIKHRFASTLVMMFVSPLITYASLSKRALANKSIYELLGIKTLGLLQACLIPWLLTMILFLGPICVQAINGLLKLLLCGYTVIQIPEPIYWINSARNLVWLRNHVVAPLSEEFIYRSCMLPLLLQSYSVKTALFINPLFFGVAHFHHMIENINAGMSFKVAFISSLFHFSYTTIFGAYSSYLFLRTGHLASSLVVHAFCNHMGFPDPSEPLNLKRGRTVVIAMYFIGLVLWMYLLNPLTQPFLYENYDSVFKVD